MEEVKKFKKHLVKKINFIAEKYERAYNWKEGCLNDFREEVLELVKSSINPQSRYRVDNLLRCYDVMTLRKNYMKALMFKELHENIFRLNIEKSYSEDLLNHKCRILSKYFEEIDIFKFRIVPNEFSISFELKQSQKFQERNKDCYDINNVEVAYVEKPFTLNSEQEKKLREFMFELFN